MSGFYAVRAYTQAFAGGKPFTPLLPRTLRSIRAAHENLIGIIGKPLTQGEKKRIDKLAKLAGGEEWAGSQTANKID